MDRESLFKHLNRRYCSKHEMLSRIPLGVQPDALWQELLQHRRTQSTALPIYAPNGNPYWYVTTDRMIAASEKIVETLYTDGADFDPFTEPPPVVTLEESFFTSYVEGAQITMQAAMDFLASGEQPRDIEEQMIANNRMAGKFATENLYRGIDTEFLHGLAYLLTDGMDNGGQDYRMTDDAEYAGTGGEQFSFPPAATIPDRIEALCAYLASPQSHPLIKAGVAQGYMQILQPFPEGNDRIGRILSSMILLRAGYTFFSDVSLSALIARKSYAYYEATANILREDNGGDLTYFLEFFMELLSRAVDERALRQQRREEQDLQTEQEMARTALTAPAIPPPVSFQNESVERPPQPPEQQELPPAAIETTDEEITASSVVQPEAADCPSEESLNRVLDLLHVCIDGNNERYRTCAELLLGFIKEGKYSFTQVDISAGCGLQSKQASRLIFQLREKGIIESSGVWDGRSMIYKFNTKPPALLQPEGNDSEAAEISDGEDLLDGFFTVPAGEPDDSSEEMQNRSNETDQEASDNTKSEKQEIERIRNQLREYTVGKGEIRRACAELFLNYIDQGKYTFVKKEIEMHCDLQTRQAANILFYFKEKGIIESCKAMEGDHLLYRFRACPTERLSKNDHSDMSENMPNSAQVDAMGWLRIHDELWRLAEKSGAITQQAATLLLSYLDSGKEFFTWEDLTNDSELTAQQAQNLIIRFKSKRLIIRSEKTAGKSASYAFNLSMPLLTDRDYATNVHDAILLLQEDDRSRKNWRLAELLKTYMPAGMIIAHRCAEYRDEEQLRRELTLPERMGIVTKIRPGIYRINRRKAYRLPALSDTQKNLLSDLYCLYENRAFSVSAASEKLHINPDVISKEIHEFRIFGVATFCEYNKSLYRLSCNPSRQPSLFAGTPSDPACEAIAEQNMNPTGSYSREYYSILDLLEASSSAKNRRLAKALRQCLDKGLLLKTDYIQWGYTDINWEKDTEYGIRIGLIRRGARGVCILNETINPSHKGLRQSTKKAITAIYKAFGSQDFTSEMYIATLRYSPSNAYASLRELALMSVVNQRTTEDGNQYHLLVNPTDNPECFDQAA